MGPYLLWPVHDVDTVTHNLLGNPRFASQAAQEYNTNRTGILTNVGGDLLGKLDWDESCMSSYFSLIIMAAFEKLPAGTVYNPTRNDLDTVFGSDWPDIEISHWTPTSDA